MVSSALRSGVECIELHTGRYANARTASETKRELENIIQSAKLARSLNLKVFAGHGLNYENVKKITPIEDIEELNIGHSIVSEAVFSGLENAVKRMLELIK